MRRQAWLLALAALAVPPPGGAQDAGGSSSQAEVGGELFFTHCAACHGTSAEGDGPLADTLEFAPPDLTRIAERNGGEFPADLVRRVVDGRDPVEGHGGPEMPIWGDAFKTREEGFSEDAAERKIEVIVSWLETVQKPE